MKPLVCRGHTRPIPSLSFSPLEADGKYLLSSSCKDGTPMLRDGQTGDWMGSFIGHKGCCWAIKLSSDGRRAITGSADFSAKVWDASNGDCILTLPHHHIVRCVDLSADGNRAVTGGFEKKLRIWDVQALLAAGPDSTPQASTSLVKDGDETGKGLAHDGVVRAVVWDDRNGQIISAGEDKALKFWDIASGKCTHEIKVQEPISSMERNMDERGMISLTYGNTVDFIDPKSREVYLTFKLPYPPSTASIHPVLADRFVTGSSADGWVRVHDSKTGEEREVYKGHHGPVHAISYSPDGALYASGSEDGTIRMWLTTSMTYGLWKFDANGGAA